MSVTDSSISIPQATTQKAPLPITRGGVQIHDMDSLWRFATAVHKSGLAPKGIATPEAILIAIEMGLEVGLPPMAALQNIAVINGRPSIWGDAQLAVVRGTGELEEFLEWYEENGTKLTRNPTAFTDKTVAVCRVKRRGYESMEVGFGVHDAKTAGLWSKDGPWKQYPARMLRFRARSFALRDSFGDALKGLRAAEEVMDEPLIVSAPADPIRVGKKNRAVEPDIPAQEVVKPASTEPTAESSAAQGNDLISIRLHESGVSFDAFAKWLITAGHYPHADSMADINDMPRQITDVLLADGERALKQCLTLHGTK